MPIDQELLDILACPKCKGDLILTKSQDGLICNACALKYHIKDDIPIMLIDEAEEIKKTTAPKKTTAAPKTGTKKTTAKKAAPQKPPTAKKAVKKAGTKKTGATKKAKDK